MIGWAVRRHDGRELVGQLLRLLLAGPGSITGRYPVGIPFSFYSAESAEGQAMLSELGADLESCPVRRSRTAGC